MNAVTHAMRDKLSRETTELALTETVLSPRFYTTDFTAMDAIDVEPVRAEWDRLMEEFQRDTNKGHFIRDERFDAFRLEDLPEGLQTELVDFLVSSVTAEF
ncbi:MAG: magnesium-protoporphyrin IX monomethyl ester (oxidative) cyclase, partial [Alphaproteobacteria bacterium]